jgi:hypothetical protein
MTRRPSRPRPAKLAIGGQIVQIDAPGLKVMRRSNGALQIYWVADETAVARGYPTKTRRLHVNLDNPAAAQSIRDLCQIEQSAMLAWLDDPAIDERPRVAHDGSLGSLVDLL